MRRLAWLFWLSLAVLSTAALVRAGSDYLTTVTSLRDFRWSAAPFVVPADEALQTSLALDVQNASSVALTMKDLEVYLWLGDTTVGKTYARFEPLVVPRFTTVRVPLVIELTPAFIRDAHAKPGNAKRWQATGMYKVNTPVTSSDFVYHLQVDIAP